MKYIYTLLLTLVLATPSYSALPPTAEWDVRSTASDSNGGFFSSARSGTDYSQQNSPQISVSDAVTNGTTTITSATANFPTDLPGNGCYIAGGTGSITAAWYEVVTRVSSTSITVDRSTGLTTGTGVTLHCGGALLTLQKAADVVADQNTIWVKATTWTFTTTVTLQDPCVTGISGQKWRGYNTTHGDRSTRPLITTSTNSTNLFTLPGCGGNARAMWDNFSFSNTATTRAAALYSAGNYAQILVTDSIFDGFTVGMLADGGTVAASGQSIGIGAIGCEFKNLSLAGIAGTYSGVNCQGCYFHDLTKDAIVETLSNTTVSVSDSIFANVGRYAMLGVGQNTLAAYNSVFYTIGTTFTGGPFPALFQPAGGDRTIIVTNSVFYGGGSAGGNTYLDVNARCIGHNNARDSTPMGCVANLYLSLGDQTLTADPFTNAASGDFSPNSATGGGAKLKALGFPGTFPGGTSVGIMNIGAIQNSTAGGGQHAHASAN